MSYIRPSGTGFSSATSGVALLFAALIARTSVSPLSRRSIGLLLSGVLFVAMLGRGQAGTISWSGGGTCGHRRFGANWGGGAVGAGGFRSLGGIRGVTPDLCTH